MPDISNIADKAVSCFLASSLIGHYSTKGENVHKYFAVVSRLIDKAKYEYLLAREAALEEEKEGKLSYEQLEKRNEGQYFYTNTITNHLENCINAVARIYKILRRLPSDYSFNTSSKAKKIRDSIEHIDERIANSVQGSVSLNIAEDASSVELVNEHLSMSDLADEIRILNKKILEFLQK